MTDADVSFTGLNKDYAGFTYTNKKSVRSHATVQPDGSTVIQLYYSRNKYTVTFDVNYSFGAGTGINVVNSIYYGADIAAAKALCPGYVFDGWYTEKTGGSQYDFGKMPAKDVTVYAHWTAAKDTPYSVAHYIQAANGGYILVETEDKTGTTGTQTTADAKSYEGFTADPITQQTIKPDGSTVVIVKYNRNKYQLTWDHNDGKNTTTTSSVMYEATIQSVTPERDGHTFTGWVYANEDGSVSDRAYQEGDTMPGHDVTLIAKWDVLSYDLSYDLNGGKLGDSTTIADEVKDYGTQITTPTTPVRTGYTFAGWKDQETVYNAEATFNMPARDMKLVAQWTANTYTVTFDVNGDEATCGTANSSLTYDQAYGELPVPTRTGHDFVGWFTQAEGGDQVTAETMMTTASEHTLYAHWTIKQYTITFKNHDGTTLKVVEQNYKTAVTAPEVTREGYTFTGWYRGENKYEVGTMPAENIELYAKWTANNGIAYQIHVYRQNVDGSWPETPTVTSPETGTADSIVTVAADRFNATGFTYDSSKANVTSGTVAVDGSLVLQLFYKRNQHTITFNTDGGSNVAPITKAYGADVDAVSDPTKTGYTFVKWMDANGADATVPNKMPAEDITLKAIWEAVTYSISYDLQDGTLAGKPATHTYGQTTEIPDPAKTGYTFDGWTVNDGSDKVKDLVLGATDYTADITLYANWTINRYTITFDTGEGSSVDPIEAAYDEQITAPEDPTRNGYTFAGWYTDPSGGSEYTVPGSMPAESVTVYARWTVVDYSVSYVIGEGGTNHVNNPETYNVEQDPFILQDPTRPHYTFNYWYIPIPFQEVTQLPVKGYNGGNLSLTAYWTPIEYSITYNLAGGTASTLTGPNPDSYNIETVTFRLNEPTRIGYTFAGWEGTGVDGTSMSVTIPKGSYGDRTYTATWIPVTYSMEYTHTVDESVSDIGSAVTDLLDEWTAEREDVTVNANNKLVLPLPTPSCDGYTFDGYQTGTISSDVTVKLTNGVYQVIINPYIRDSIKVTVKWKKSGT